MGSVCRLLLVAVLVLAIAADVLADVTLSTLTLAPDANSLISTRDDTSTTSTATSPAVIGSATSDSNIKITETPATETPATETLTTTAPTSSISKTTSASNSDEEEKEDTYPPSVIATIFPSDRSSSGTHSDKASKSASSKPSTSNVDTLNDDNGGISSGGSSTNIGTLLPVVFGCLACVGAIVIAVTYKNKRNANYPSEGARLSSDCEYACGADFTPENRAMKNNKLPVGVKVSGLTKQSSGELSAAAAIADFTGALSSVSASSPFGGTSCNGRVSSPIPSHCSSNETNMEFQDIPSRHNGGSNVVLTIDDTNSTEAGTQVQL